MVTTASNLDCIINKEKNNYIAEKAPIKNIVFLMSSRDPP